MQQSSEADTGAIAYSVEEAARRISVGRTTMFALIGSGVIRTVQIGSRRLVPDRELRRYFDDRLDATA